MVLLQKNGAKAGAKEEPFEFPLRSNLKDSARL